jgi:hypothetical protein
MQASTREGGGGVISPVIYWLCCRYAPRNSHNMRTVGLSSDTFGIIDEGNDMGLKPSQAKNRSAPAG